MECGAAEATGLGFVCFVVINPRVLSANRVYFGLFSFFFFFLFNFTPFLVGLRDVINIACGVPSEGLISHRLTGLTDRVFTVTTKQRVGCFCFDLFF